MSSNNNNDDDDSYLSKIQKALATSDVNLRSAIKSGVEATNKTLASLEQSTEQIRRPVSNAVQIIGKEGQNVAQHATHWYQTRRDYAPAWIGGSAVVGGLIGLRRGRVPAAITASVTGFLSYLVVYEVDVSKLPEHVFGKK